MASLILKHSINTLKLVRPSSSLPSRRRAIHFTSGVQKQKAAVDIEDLFGDETASEHDLFAESTLVKTETSGVQKEAIVKSKGSSTSTTPIEGSSTSKGRVRVSSDPFKRSASLNKQMSFMKPRLGTSPLKKQPKIRSRSWLTMIQLAKDGEDMRNIVDLIPLLHEGGGTIPGIFAEQFVRRCEQLACQCLALEVFGNYAKYNVTLTPNAGRWLIHSVHVLHPLQDLLIAASLFSVYNIPLAEDLVSSSMFTAACFKHDTPQTRAMANLMLPEIKRMVEEEEIITTLPVSDVETKRQLKWVDWSLKKINKFVKKESGIPFVPLPAVQVQASNVQP